MSSEIRTVIDEEKCIGCGTCVEICPTRALQVVGGKATVVGDQSMHCDHCAAACPSGAITVNAVDRDALDFATFERREDWIEFGDFDTAALVQFMRSRRSCRSFRDEPVSIDLLEDLIKIGITAPSGTNSQLWSFTILPSRKAVLGLAEEVGGFFRRLNGMAEKKTARLLSKALMGDALGIYYREYYETVKEALTEWRETGRDCLFHGAPAAIVVGVKPGASCPKEDALIASENMVLAAHAMGLGTCFIGFAVEAIRRKPSIKHKIGIPDREAVYTVIAIGKPAEKYKRLAGRKKVIPRIHEG